MSTTVARRPAALLLISLAALVCRADRPLATSAAAPAPAHISAQKLTDWTTRPEPPRRTHDANPASTEEAEIVAGLKRFFETTDQTRRKEIARRIESNKAYDPAKVGDWLHRAGLHGPLRPGTQTVSVALEDGQRRSVVLRVPEGYDPAKRWPLILAYHHTGGAGEDMIRLLARVMGRRIDQFVVAAPTNYLPLNVDSARAWRPEQRLVLRELRRLAHVDGERVYVTGFSQGCYASWSYAAFYGDELAGSAPVACTFDAAPEIPGLWESLLPNLAAVPVLHVWGSEDRLPVYGLDLKTVRGTANELNKRVAELTGTLKLNVLNYRIPGGGHAYDPPSDLLTKLFEMRRTPQPRRVRQRFRYLVQGRAHWLEALSWDGAQWGPGARTLDARPGETREQVIGRTINDLLAHMDGEISGREINVTHRHVGSFAVWLGDGMIDWTRPVRVVSNGAEVFKGEVKRDLYLCLTEAARTYDFDRLRWAGLQVTKDGRAEVVSSSDARPAVVFGPPK